MLQLTFNNGKNNLPFEVRGKLPEYRHQNNKDRKKADHKWGSRVIISFFKSKTVDKLLFFYVTG